MKFPLFGLAAMLLATVGPAASQETMVAGDAMAGAKIFKKCMACHMAGPDAENSVGPALNGIVGRKAGTYPDYNYSSAIRDSGLVWDEPTLTAYLRAPRKVVPGTRMTFAGLKKDKDIADVIAFLKQFDANGTQANSQQ